MLGGYPNLMVARISLYGSMVASVLQVCASAFNSYDSSDIFSTIYLVVSATVSLSLGFSHLMFLQFSKSDMAKLGLVSMDDMSKIARYNEELTKELLQMAEEGEGHMSRLDRDREDTMTLDDLRESGVLDDGNGSELGVGIEMELTTTGVKEEEEEVVNALHANIETEIPIPTAEPVTYSTVKYADETNSILISQLKDAGVVPIEYIPLPTIKAEIAAITQLVLQEKPFDEARFDYLFRCQAANPEYQAEQAEITRLWREKVSSFTQESLSKMRAVLSAGIFKHSIQSLQAESGYSIGLCKRLINKKCLWLIRLTTADIGKMHEADLMNKFNPIGQALDIIELASILCHLPDKFQNDPSGKKNRFKSDIETSFKEMMSKMEQGTLRANLVRNPLYKDTEGVYGRHDSLYAMNRKSTNTRTSTGAGTRMSNVSTPNPLHSRYDTGSGSGSSSVFRSREISTDGVELQPFSLKKKQEQHTTNTSSLLKGKVSGVEPSHKQSLNQLLQMQLKK